MSVRFWGAFLLMCASACSPAWGARLALVIGNDSYAQVTPLKNARNDATLMKNVLMQSGFQVTQASNLNRTAMWAALDAFRLRIQKGDEVVFYFAGHGVQIQSNQLLLPVDISAQNEAQVQRDGVPLVEVQDYLKDARVAILIIDACRDNPFPKIGTRSIGASRGLGAPPEPAAGQVILMSAGRNQKALDSVPGGSQSNGLFTWVLGQSLLSTKGDIRAVLEKVKDAVDEKAREVGHEQRPSLVNDLRGEYVFGLDRGQTSERLQAVLNPNASVPSIPSMASTSASTQNAQKPIRISFIGNDQWSMSLFAKGSVTLSGGLVTIALPEVKVFKSSDAGGGSIFVNKLQISNACPRTQGNPGWQSLGLSNSFFIEQQIKKGDTVNLKNVTFKLKPPDYSPLDACWFVLQIFNGGEAPNSPVSYVPVYSEMGLWPDLSAVQ